MAEVAYRLARQGGATAVATLLEQLPLTKIRIVALTETDLTQTVMILRQYANSRIDFVDATIIVVAERMQRIAVNPMALAALYQESAVEDKFLAEVGLSHYAEMLAKEDIAQ